MLFQHWSGLSLNGFASPARRNICFRQESLRLLRRFTAELFVATIVTGCRACRDLDAPAPAELPYKARNSSAVPSRARRTRSGMLLTAPQMTSGSLSGSTPTTDSYTGSGPSRSL